MGAPPKLSVIRKAAALARARTTSVVLLLTSVGAMKDIFFLGGPESGVEKKRKKLQKRPCNRTTKRR
jgi:hypothetical protein